MILEIILVILLSIPSQNGAICPETRQIVGEHSRTTTELNLRPEPGTILARIGVIPEGVTLAVVDGPQCNEGYSWWQVEYDGQTGWVAEGTEEDYWLEPRGQLLTIEAPDGNTYDYILHDDGILERAECSPPPEDYEQQQLGYATLNQRTLAMLDNAQRIYAANGGVVVNFRQSITQGSYNAGGVSASFGTHDGGGAVDISVRSVIDWSLLETEIEPMIQALRLAGFAAWVRETGELYDNSPIHIHAIAVGDADLSPAARRQIDGLEGYLRGYNGLPVEDYGDGEPIPDRYGDPVICRWMIDAGFDDLREIDHYQQGLDYLDEGFYYHAIDSLSRAVRNEGENDDVLEALEAAYAQLSD